MDSSASEEEVKFEKYTFMEMVDSKFSSTMKSYICETIYKNLNFSKKK